ncbi:MAG: IS66 family transposase [Phocaeicola sp.]
MFTTFTYSNVRYRKLQSELFPSIKRIPCLQHIKRKFIDCGESDKDAVHIVGFINKLYQQEHKHKIGVEGGRVEMNIKHRQTHAPKILNEISEDLSAIESIEQ